MGNLLESYRVLGVKVGADLADVTTSYKQLCREYHPDISDNPEAEELMKQVNIAYTVLREKFKREAAFRDKQSHTRPVRRYPPEKSQTVQEEKPRTTNHQSTAKAYKQAADTYHQAAEAFHKKAAEQAATNIEAEIQSRTVLHDYFKAINTFDFKKAYSFLSGHDKRNITLDAFISWRESVAKLYPMREFKIAGGSSIAMVTWGGSKIFHARKFRVVVTEDDYTASSTQSGELDKLVTVENGVWGVFLGYKEVSELTRTFEKRFETKKKHDIEKRWEEYKNGINAEYDMFNADGMRKELSKELYRQRRYGTPITFVAVSVKLNEEKSAGQAELLRSAAKTINGTLREIDIPAYVGDGVFAVLFAQLGKRNADNVVRRLADTIIKNAGPGIGENAQVEYHFDSWSENRYADLEDIGNVLRKLNKNI